MKRKTFNNSNGRGFQIKFPNGVTLSTQFGWGNYCENNSNIDIDKFDKRDWQSNDAEIAIIGSNGAFITSQFRKGDDVIGYADFRTWVKAFKWCLSRKPTS